jgi:basic amino acid/polyamine antiporter, APA family
VSEGPAGFRRELGLGDSTVLVAGAILGVGIFVNPSNVARLLATPEWMLLAWIAGGAVAMIGGFLYAELGSRLPLVGGQYVYLARAWGPLAGFLYGFALLFVINTGGIAAVATVLAATIDSTFIPLGAAGRFAVAAGTILLLAEINVRGVRPGKQVNNALMALKLAGVAGVAALVLASDRPPATTLAWPPPEAPGFSLFFAALVPILFAYGGWQNCGSVAAEIRDAPKTLARANILGVALIVAVYVGLNFLYLRALAPAEVAASSALAADVARSAAGAGGARFVAALIAVSCLGFLAVMTLTGPRLYFAMARDGSFLRRAGELHPRHGTPAFTLRLQAAIAVVLLATQSYDQLLSYVVFCDWLFFGLAAAAIFVLRRRDGNPPGVFQAPGHPVTTLLFLAVAAAVTINCVFTAPKQAAAGLAILAAGAFAYFIGNRRRAGRGDRATPSPGD